MDQDAFRRTYRDVNQRACVYEKSILTNQCNCTAAQRFCIAEREGVSCASATGHDRCAALLATLRERARFALRTDRDRDQPLLPHGKAIRIQVGGLRGLYLALHPGAPTPPTIEDVDGLLRDASARFGGLQGLPYSEMMQQVAAYQGRQRRRRRDER